MSRTDKSGRIDRFLPAELLQKMREHSTGQARWQHAWQRSAGEVRDKAEPVGYSEGVLVLRVASSGWASRLRYQSGALIERLRLDADFSALTDIEIRVRPKADPEVEQTQQRIREERTRYDRKAIRMSDHAAEVIQTAADTIEDPDLKQALQRLSKRKE